MSMPGDAAPTRGVTATFRFYEELNDFLAPARRRREFSVRDTGMGIEPETLPRMFEMFSRGLRDGGQAQGGLGIGLALSRRLAEMHGGTLDGRSEGTGKGSEFTVTLPALASAQKAPANPRRPGAEPRGDVRRVLVVDDNVDAAQTLAEYLRLEGHRVESALDGESALRIAEMLHPEVAFIDLNMPGMDGIEVARRLRKTPWGRQARLVALTGMGQLTDVARTRAAGFDEHLTKPAELSRVSRLAAA